jgi:hypothetical protein
MASRELDALEYLRLAEGRLVNHRGFVRSRPKSSANDDEHEIVSQALGRTREALALLERVTCESCGRAVRVPRCAACGGAEPAAPCQHCGAT